MKNLYSDKLGIDYGQFYITVNSEEEVDMDPDGSFEGQNNGLCGSQVGDMIFFVVGIQSGSISIDVQLHQFEPELDRSFDEIVEVSFERGTFPMFLCEWGWESEHELDIPKGIHRLRYSILGMELEHSEEAIEKDEDIWESPVPGQKHMIQIWPTSFEEDAIVKQTSETAAYWHREWGNQKTS